MDDRELLRQRFDSDLADWGIELPVDAMSPGKVWFIVQQEWTIWTRFDSRAGDGAERGSVREKKRRTHLSGALCVSCEFDAGVTSEPFRRSQAQ